MLFDRASISGSARITRDGYLVADALVARANNIQDYSAAELGVTDRAPTDRIRVFRPESEVFSRDALASLAHRPVTLDHPTQDVNSANWRDLAVGDTGGEVIRDGEFVRVPLKVMDSAAIDSIQRDRREFSLGYSLTLDMTPGEHAGQAYDAVARDLRYNHLAAVRSARGGPQLRIVDERTDPKEPAMKIKIGDAEVDATNGEAVRVAVDALNVKFTSLNDAKTAAETALAAAVTDKSTLEAKVTTLETQLADAKLTPAKLRDAARAYQAVCDKAKALGVTVTDEMDEPAIMQAVVSAKLGDAAKDWTAEQIAASFASLAKDVKVADTTVHDIGRPTIADQDKARDDAYAAMVADMTNRQSKAA